MSDILRRSKKSKLQNERDSLGPQAQVSLSVGAFHCPESALFPALVSRADFISETELEPEHQTFHFQI